MEQVKEKKNLIFIYGLDKWSKPQLTELIDIHCKGCGKSYRVRRTAELPEWVEYLRCNFCPECEGRADEYYREWYGQDKRSARSRRMTEAKRFQLKIAF